MPEGQEMTLEQWVKRWAPSHPIRKEYRDLLDAAKGDPTADRVASNISAVRDIHEQSLRLIAALCSQSLSAHPEHPDTYPEILLAVKRGRAGKVR